jgi:hypothetical protein
LTSLNFISTNSIQIHHNVWKFHFSPSIIGLHMSFCEVKDFFKSVNLGQESQWTINKAISIIQLWSKRMSTLTIDVWLLRTPTLNTYMLKTIVSVIDQENNRKNKSTENYIRELSRFPRTFYFYTVCWVILKKEIWLQQSRTECSL